MTLFFISRFAGRDRDNPSLRGRSNENYEQRSEVSASAPNALQPHEWRTPQIDRQCSLWNDDMENAEHIEVSSLLKINTTTEDRRHEHIL